MAGIVERLRNFVYGNPAGAVEVAEFWAGPNESVVIEDDSAPKTDEVVVHSGASFSIPNSYLLKTIALNEDTILARGGGLGLKMYEELLDDDVTFSNFQSRRLDVVSKEWEVAPGDEDDPRSVEAAEHLKQQLKAMPFDRICDKMLYGIWFGYSVGEGLYRLGADGKYWLADIVVPDRKWFAFTNEGEARFRPGYMLEGEPLPPNKFWIMRTGASHDFAFYGLGLAHWCYWPVWFKRNIIRFWAFYLEKLGYPTVVGETPKGSTDQEKRDLMIALTSIGRDRAVRVGEDMLKDEKIKLFEAARSGSGVSDYLDFITEQNEALMRVIRGQPGTSKATPQGIGGKQAEVHEDVAAKIAKADSDLLCESFNGTFPVWLTRWNFGEDVAPPRVYRVFDEAEDLNTVAERDSKLAAMHFHRTEESFKDVYGDGYEYREPEPPPQLDPALGAVPPNGNKAANDDELAKRNARRATFAADEEAPLYVYRQLKNSGPLAKWARAAGIPNLVPAADYHVTVLHSRTPVDWFAMSDGWAYNAELVVPEGGARRIARLDGGAIVLRFAQDDLTWSHQRKIERGASHSHATYKPHVTLGFDPDKTFDVEALNDAFTGELKFGPEMFERVKPFLLPGINPIEFTAAEEDAIERLAASLADETNPLILEFGAALTEALEGVANPEAARVALLEAFERMPVERMTSLFGLPLLAERMSAEAGVEP